MKQKLTELKEENDNSTTIVRNSNTQLLIIDRITEQKVSKGREDLNPPTQQQNTHTFKCT